MVNLTKEELKHLQKLSNVNIDESWEFVEIRFCNLNAW